MNTTKPLPKTGLIVDVFRDGYGDSSNRGLSSKHAAFVLLDENVVGPFAPSEDQPALRIVRRTLPWKAGGGTEVYMHLVPVGLEDKQTMFGGTFAYSSDSRFPASYPLPIHDRIE